MARQRRGRFGFPTIPSAWGLWSHVWVIGWLALPLPILFHPPFLRGTIWPVIGLR
jgi:hypothetical protein